MKTWVELKNRPFTIRVIQGNKQNKLLPGFLCKSLLKSNKEVENNPTNTISKLYKKIFQTETRFSGTLVMGMDDNNILDEIVSDLSFQPFSIHIQKINIIIYLIGILAKQRTGCEFTSSFIYTKSKERTLFFQTVSENGCSIYVYKKNQLFEEFYRSDTNSVWEKIGILKEWLGVTLFGLDNSNEWKDNDCQIIELHSRLGLLYPKDYIFSEREIRAWRAILHATGCINITSFDKGESEVSSHTIHNAKIHRCVYGHGCPATLKPLMRRKIMPQEHDDQFEWFMSSKENMNLSSYKVDAKIGLPLKYLNNQKEALWEKFYKLYPNGIKMSAFLKRLQKGPFVYQEDLGGLCSTCNTYGYDMFKELTNLIIQNIENQELQRTKQDFYAKHGWSLHTVLIYPKNKESNELEIQAFDHWSNNNRQDAWFTASSFDAVFNLLNPKPKWIIVMNGLSGISTAYLKPNRDQRSQSNVKTIPGISNWFEWSWPTEGPLAGYVCACNLPDFGEMMIFSIMLNTDYWDLRRWSVDKLRDELNRRNIHFDVIMGRDELVNLLKQEIGEESQIGEGLRGDFPKINIDENQMFYLQLGWALMRNQKYGKKGSGKRLTKEVVAALTHFFMVEQRDPSDQYSAKDMLDGLKEMVENGEITTEVIPFQKTIENWITRFSSLSKKEHAKCFLEE
ncbi:hypothetical protein RclHR1_17450001 [Rhizophagus clarus]|uniref:Uncharacterized protein n=1 Tax=Rhizophagus clarus TaxID=94130 RepID=A0A2Z6QK43_9GLOM|nr:hypothetical protein RclHR1_17450001 [Rhizophagus clarus]